MYIFACCIKGKNLNSFINEHIQQKEIIHIVQKYVIMQGCTNLLM